MLSFLLLWLYLSVRSADMSTDSNGQIQCHRLAGIWETLLVISSVGQAGLPFGPASWKPKASQNPQKHTGEEVPDVQSRARSCAWSHLIGA